MILTAYKVARSEGNSVLVLVNREDTLVMCGESEISV